MAILLSNDGGVLASLIGRWQVCPNKYRRPIRYLFPFPVKDHTVSGELQPMDFLDGGFHRTRYPLGHRWMYGSIQ